MGAYFQNQLITKNRDGEDQIRVFSSRPLEFLSSQKITSFGAKKTIEQLMLHSDKEQTLKAYCVCDYDRAVHKSNARPYFSPEKIGAEVSKAVFKDDNGFKLIVENSEYTTFTYNPQTRDYTEPNTPLIEGYVINADTNEYISMVFALIVSMRVKDKHKTDILSPLSLLTRKGSEAMGGGDIYFVGEYADQLAEITGRWYDSNLYWSNKAPKSANDITESCLWYLDVNKPVEQGLQLVNTSEYLLDSEVQTITKNKA